MLYCFPAQNETVCLTYSPYHTIISDLSHIFIIVSHLLKSMDRVILTSCPLQSLDLISDLCISTNCSRLEWNTIHFIDNCLIFLLIPHLLKISMCSLSFLPLIEALLLFLLPDFQGISTSSFSYCNKTCYRVVWSVKVDKAVQK